MSDYAINANVSVEFSVSLTENAYIIPYVFPLVVYKKGTKVNQKSLPALKEGEFKIIDNSTDPIVKIMEIQEEKDRMEALTSVLPTIDPIRKPWVIYKILEIARNIKRTFVPMAMNAVMEYPDAISHAQILANHYHLNGNNDASYAIGRLALSRPGLFWEKQAKMNINSDLSIVSFWVQDLDVGHKAADTCCLEPNFGDKKNLKSNRYFYNRLQNVTPDFSKTYPIETKPTEDGQDVYKPLNPSIIQDENGYFGTFRTVNYDIIKSRWIIHNPAGKWITVNYLLTFDDKMNILTKRELIWDDAESKFPCIWNGIEDIRLIDRTRFTATIPEANPGGFPMMFLCHYDFDSARVTRIIPMIKEHGRMEKNWLPFYVNGQLKCIYGYKPFTMFSINRDTGALSNMTQRNLPIEMDGIKGSAPPVPYNLDGEDGYLFTVHESIQAEDALQYLNRIVWMDKHFTIRRMSQLFRFDNSHQIEMITSITTHGNNISFWTGVNDREVVRNMLYNQNVNELLEWVQLN